MKTIGIMLRRKFIIFNEARCQEIEANTEEYPRISDILLPNQAYNDGHTDEAVEPVTIEVPYGEFRELVFGLPRFDDLPILSLALKQRRPGSEFIVRCFDGDEDSIGDEIYISTEGYDYPRYKSAVLARANHA